MRRAWSVGLWFVIFVISWGGGLAGAMAIFWTGR